MIVWKTSLDAQDLSSPPVNGPWVRFRGGTDRSLIGSLQASASVRNLAGTGKSVTLQIETSVDQDVVYDLFTFAAMTADDDQFAVTPDGTNPTAPVKPLTWVRGVITAVGNANNTGDVTIAFD
jgi:hypothetical protein